MHRIEISGTAHAEVPCHFLFKMLRTPLRPIFGPGCSSSGQILLTFQLTYIESLRAEISIRSPWLRFGKQLCRLQVFSLVCIAACLSESDTSSYTFLFFHVYLLPSRNILLLVLFFSSPRNKNYLSVTTSAVSSSPQQKVASICSSASGTSSNTAAAQSQIIAT